MWWVVYFLLKMFTLFTPVCGGNGQDVEEFSGLALPTIVEIVYMNLLLNSL